MNSIFNPEDYRNIVSRIEKLTAGAARQWGKMEPAQMLAHCSATVRVAIGDVKLNRLFIGRIIGPFARKNYVGPNPFKHESPTAKEFIISDAREFEKEKQELLGLVKRLHEGGEKNVTTHPHGFFGPLTPQEWGLTQWKHLDHHLRQFGV